MKARLVRLVALRVALVVVALAWLSAAAVAGLAMAAAVACVGAAQVIRNRLGCLTMRVQDAVRVEMDRAKPEAPALEAPPERTDYENHGCGL